MYGFAPTAALPYATLPEAGVNSYTIAGAVTVTATPAATMAYNRNASIAGAVLVEFIVAAAMTYSDGENPWRKHRRGGARRLWGLY